MTSTAAKPERSGVHLTGTDSGWPVAGDGEEGPRKDGYGNDPFNCPDKIEGGLIYVNDQQRVDVNGDGGTFTLTHDSQVTAAIDYDASAAEVKAALEGLANLPADSVEVVKKTDEYGIHYWVEFVGAKGHTHMWQLTGSAANLTGEGKSVSAGQYTAGSPESELSSENP